jgi:hypothetical protein
MIPPRGKNPLLQPDHFRIFLTSIISPMAKNLILVTLFLSISGNLLAQDTKSSKTKFVVGLSAPELFHIGLSYRINNTSQLGTSLGIFPSWGETFTAISLEHRLYLGKNNGRTNQKTWFFRQGTSYWLLPHDITLNFTIGKDLPFKNSKNGISIDLGLISLRKKLNTWYGNTLTDTEFYWQKYPAIRFELYFS